MKDYVRETLDYYNEQTLAYATNSALADMKALYKLFGRYIVAGGKILDLGCGTGRDSLHFQEEGYRVTAVDGSLKMCGFAECVLKTPVRNLQFSQLDYEEEFNGVWASDSLGHVASHEILEVLEKIKKSLKPSGVLYMGFKKGEFEGMRDGRYFCDYTDEKLNSLLDAVGGFSIAEYLELEDAREGYDYQWLNVILKKED